MASSYWFNVLDYGATGNGVSDDTTAIQTAINSVPSSGGTVVFPAGTYKISSALVVRSNLILEGVGDGASVIAQSSTTANGLTGSDVTRVTLADLTVRGPGSGTGRGIVFTRSANPATVSLALARMTVTYFGGTGIELSNPIVSTFTGVTSADNGNHGWDIHGVSGGAAGTSCSFVSCYADTVTNAGFHLDTMAYCSFVGCAADNCGIGYEVTGIGSQSISFTGCGAESAVDRGTGYNGYGWKINAAIGVGLFNPFTYNSPNSSIWVTGGARAVSILGFAENTPAAPAVDSVKVDSGCSATLGDCSNVRPLSLAGYTNIINDTAGGTVASGFVYGSGSAYYEGNVSTTAAPTAAEHLTRKDYVDSRVAPAPVTLTDAPTIATNAASGTTSVPPSTATEPWARPPTPPTGSASPGSSSRTARAAALPSCSVRSSAWEPRFPRSHSPPRRTSGTSSPRSTTPPVPSGT